MAKFREFIFGGKQILVNVDALSYIANIGNNKAELHFIGSAQTLIVEMRSNDLVRALNNPHITQFDD